MTERSTEHPPTPRTSNRSDGSRYAAMLLGSSLTSGLGVYGYLVVAKRGMTLDQWSHFSVFWSVALVVGFGFFLPLEQESSRLLRPGMSRVALRPLALVAASAGLAACVALLLGLPALLSALRQERALFLLLLLLVAVSAIQFFARGVMLGLGHRRAYVTALAGDGLLRLALAAALLLKGPRGALPFAAALLVAILLSHLVPLVVVLRRVSAVGSPTHTDPPDFTGRLALGGWVRLLPASLAAQALQNGAPFAVALVATGPESNAAGPFLAAFTVARIPLFMAVPIQSALVPPLAQLARAGQSHRVVSLVARLAGVTTAAAVLGALGALVVGRPVVGLLFGPELLVPGGDLALMVAGVCMHVGLLVVTQALVALNLHARAGLAWTAGLSAAAVVFLVVQPLLLRAELAFLVGSVVGGVVATIGMSRTAGRAAGPRAASP
jgi:O-antigen/teichoic acid export membrane protein